MKVRKLLFAVFTSCFLCSIFCFYTINNVISKSANEVNNEMLFVSELSNLDETKTIVLNANNQSNKNIDSDEIDVAVELENQYNYYINLLNKCTNLDERQKIVDLIESNRILNQENNNLIEADKNGASARSSIPYSFQINLVNAFFQSKGYVLASELLLHAFNNAELDSMYTPVNKARVMQSSVFQGLKTNSLLSGSGNFQNSGTTIDEDLYYAIHSFRYLKSPSGRVINIEDRYDYEKQNNYSSIPGIAIGWMYEAQEVGTLTPFFTSISVPYDDMAVVNESKNITIGDSRYNEFPMGIASKETRTFNITFSRSGTKVLQTFGSVDTIMELYDNNNDIITEDDDSGSGTNSYILFYAQANVTYKVIIYLYDNMKYGATKLSITNSFNDQIPGHGPMNTFSDIFDIIHENFNWYTYVGEHYSSLLRIVPPTRGRYQLDAISEFDNYMYIIDPRSGFPIRNCDYNDDGGEDTNSRIVKDLNAGTNYLVVYSQYYPAGSFANYDTGDDLLFQLRKIKSL